MTTKAAIFLLFFCGSVLPIFGAPPAKPYIVVNAVRVTSSPVLAVAQTPIHIFPHSLDFPTYYTLDGSEPTFLSTRFTGGFSFTTTKTIKAIAYTSDFSESMLADSVEVQIVPGVNLGATGIGGAITVTPGPVNGKYPINSTLQLRAVPSGAFRFLYWSGDVSGSSNPVFLTMDGNKQVTGNCGTSLTLTPLGHGQIRATPSALDAVVGSTVTLTPVPDAGYYLGVWGADGVGSSVPYPFAINKPNPTVSALFVTLPENKVTLTTYAEEFAGGRVEVRNLSGAVAAQASYDKGDIRRISAIANQGWAFAGWTGDANGFENPLRVTLDSSKKIIAHFEPGVMVTVIATDGGTVAKTPNQQVYAFDSSVQLEAHPLPGYEFVDWTGSQTSTQNPLTVTATRNLTFIATFRAMPKTAKWTYAAASTIRGIAADQAGNAFAISGRHIAKVTPEGQAAWDHVLYPNWPSDPGRSYPGEAWDIAIDRDGNAFVPMWGGAPDMGGMDKRIAKYNSAGVMQTGFQMEGAAEKLSLAPNGTVYIPGRSWFYILNPPDTWLQAFGPASWKYSELYPSGNPDFPGSALFSRPAVGLNGLLYATSLGSTNAVVCLNPAGQLQWRFTGERGFTSFPSPPIIGGETIYAIDGSGRLIALSMDGAFKWEFRVSEILQPPSIGADDTLYLGSQSHVYALNSNGSVRWEKTPGRPPYGIPAIGSDGTVYVTDDNSLHALDKNGNQLWNYSDGSRLFDPIVAGANIYTATGSRLIAIAANANGAANSPWPMVDGSRFGDAQEQEVKPAPVIDLAALEYRADGFHLVIHGEAGATIRIYHSTELETWTLLHTETSVSGDVTFVHAPDGTAQHFYRVAQSQMKLD